MWKQVLYDVFSYGILVYSVTILISYIFIGIYAIGETRGYLRKNSFTDYSLLASSPHAPSVSILAPAYNEGISIVENVRSLLSINYNHLEVIVINDGSKDDSMLRLIDAYDLHRVQQLYSSNISTKRILGIYKSRNPVYNKLLVIDKENGGKADALNVGINLAANKYIVCIDVDCILEQDALFKLVKPFMEETTKTVIATGGVVRIANSCVFENGKLVEVKLPKQFLPRVQTLEYIRAFLLARMAWSRLNGLLIISGAFGAFDRDIVTKVGGYNTNTVGEDMELVVRMRRYMEEKKSPYKIAYIPDPLCWTEAPASYKILGRQRNRWMRGTVETLKTHRKLFFNPDYGVLGMLSYPYWFFFEFLAPIIEFTGMLGFIFFICIGIINWQFFFALLGFVLLFGWLYSAFAILMEVLTYNQYKKRGEVAKLLLTAVGEPFFFHPFVIWSSIKGNIDLLRNKHSWGEMTRQGFHAKESSPNTASNKGFVQSLNQYASYSAGLLLLLLLLRIADFIHNGLATPLSANPAFVLSVSLLNDLAFFLKINLLFGLLYVLLFQLNKKAADIVIIMLTLIAALISFALAQYFNITLVPLGADLFSYSWKDIRQAAGASGGINLANFLLIAGVAAALLFIYKWISPLFKKTAKWINLAACLIAAVWITIGLSALGKTVINQEYANNLSKSKPDFFLSSAYNHFFSAEPKNFISRNKFSKDIAIVSDINAEKFPFLHTDSTADVLSPFFNSTDKSPDIVIILVEGLGRAFSNKDAYLGSFTPFLDSLSEHSLYWSNFLSNGGRTFALLPSLLGSLPYANNGFNELGDKMPGHLSLVSLLKYNGYQTSFYYGGDASFDNMSLFLHKQKIDYIYDESTFPKNVSKLPANESAFTWGYGDKELYGHVLNTGFQNTANQPSLKVILTIATHSPFLISNQQFYTQQFERQMGALNFSEQQKTEHRVYEKQYSTIMYADDALRSFINSYRQKSGFGNTVFLITGDHRMPEIPMSTKIDRYHVPLIIYSPLLKKTAKFESVSAHSDITPTLLTYLKNNFKIQVPQQSAWMSGGIDTAHNLRNVHSTALKQTKGDLLDFIMGDYHLNDETLFKLKKDLDEEPVTGEATKAKLTAAFTLFKQKNKKFAEGAQLMPEAIYEKYAPK